METRGSDNVHTAFLRYMPQHFCVPAASQGLGIHHGTSPGCAVQIQFLPAFFRVINTLIRVNCRGIALGDTQVFVALAKS
jgi:hypothetical protein